MNTMNKVNYNGFASEEQYEAAMNIIKNAIDEYADVTKIEKFDDFVMDVTIYSPNNHPFPIIFRLYKYKDKDGFYTCNVGGATTRGDLNYFVQIGFSEMLKNAGTELFNVVGE